MRLLAKGLVRGKGLYQCINPAWPKALKVCKVKWVLRVVKVISFVKKYHKAKSIDEVVIIFSKEMIEGVAFGFIGKKTEGIYKRVQVARRLNFKSKGVNGKTWINSESDDYTRIVKQMRVMFHHATNPHLDIHIGHLSLVINLGGKSIMNDIKFNKSGELTEKSRVSIINFLREELINNSRMAQNFDHSIRNTETSWNVGEAGITGYGSGLTRQTVVNEPIEIMSVDGGTGKTIKMYCPILNKHRLLYLHKLYSGDKKRAPIVTWGVIKKIAPAFNDRLHLKNDKKIDMFRKNVDLDTVTKKYDGASAYFDTGEKETTWWSPRISSETGDRIQYTGKVPELFRIKSKEHPRGIGELMFIRKINLLNPFNRRVLTAAETGGILNSDKIRPMNIIPVFVVYRMDRWGGNYTSYLPFKENRGLQQLFADMCGYVELPEFVSIRIHKSIEGIVGVPKDKSINEGRKHRFWGDPHDWQVVSVNLMWGPKGKPAGAIKFKSLDTGKIFKLGPGQLGKENEFVDLLNKGNTLIGAVAKVNSRHGHEGRAAKLAEWHLDKGTG